MAVGKIQRTSRGLLQFLGMVGTGVPPTLMADEVRPAVDLLHFFGTTQIIRVGASGAANAQNPGDAVVATVPSDTYWIMLGGNVAVGPAAAGDIMRTSFRVQVTPAAPGPVATGQVQLGQSELMTAQAANAVLSFGLTLPQPFILSPGDSIRGTVLDSNVAAALDMSVFALVYQFPT